MLVISACTPSLSCWLFLLVHRLSFAGYFPLSLYIISPLSLYIISPLLVTSPCHCISSLPCWLFLPVAVHHLPQLVTSLCHCTSSLPCWLFLPVTVHHLPPSWLLLPVAVHHLPLAGYFSLSLYTISPSWLLLSVTVHHLSLAGYFSLSLYTISPLAGYFSLSLYTISPLLVISPVAVHHLPLAGYFSLSLYTISPLLRRKTGHRFKMVSRLPGQAQNDTPVSVSREFPKGQPLKQFQYLSDRLAMVLSRPYQAGSSSHGGGDDRDHLALRPQKRGCLLATGEMGMEGGTALHSCPLPSAD